MAARDRVRVLSEIGGGWVDGEITEPLGDNRVLLGYGIGEAWHRKVLPKDSEKLDLRPEVPARATGDFSKEEALAALERDVFVRVPTDSDDPLSISEANMHLEAYKNNAFTVVGPTKADLKICYKGPWFEDVLIKVYVLSTEFSRTDYERYKLVGYFHAMQRPRPPVLVSAGYFLGLVAHRNLNADWLWKMDSATYDNFVNRSTDGGYEERGDPTAKDMAGEADYVISFTTGNKEENDKLLRSLSSAEVEGPHGVRPIHFCTDRSLGFGGHFDAPKGLYLAKHAFGRSTAPGAWFEEYREAITKSKSGMLILNFTVEYFQSRACRQEVSLISEHEDLVSIYIPDRHIIVPWPALQDDPSLIVGALGRYSSVEANLVSEVLAKARRQLGDPPVEEDAQEKHKAGEDKDRLS